MSKPAFLFPGQGAQKVGMGRDLIDSTPESAQLFQQASDILGYDLVQLCLEGPAEKLNSTVYSQPALYVASLAALEKLKRDNPEVVAECAATAGLSLGEYTALVFAGVMSFEDGLRVVQQRGQAMQEAADLSSSGMVSLLGLDVEQVEQVVAESRGDNVLEVANLLCPGNTAISGETEACGRASQAAEAAGAKIFPLAVAGAFHTSLMEPAVEKLRTALANVALAPPRIPVVSNVDAQPHNDPEEIRELLVRQVVSPVKWELSMRYLLDDECTQMYEIGPGRVLRGLMKRINRKFPFESVEA